MPPSERLCATPPPVWYDAAMVTLLTIEPINEAHGMLIVEAFNRFFIDGGGLWDSETCGWGYGNGDGEGDGFDDYYGDGKGGGGYALPASCPEEWRTK